MEKNRVKIGDYCDLVYTSIKEDEERSIVFIEFDLTGGFALSKDEYEKLLAEKNPSIQDVTITFIETQIEQHRGGKK